MENTVVRYSKKYPKYNREFFLFVDLKKNMNTHRFSFIYPSADKAVTYKVSHGYGSDPDGDGYINRVGDRVGSGMNDEGVFVTSGVISTSKFTKAIALCGLSKTNSKAKRRGILVHPAERKDKKTGKVFDYLDKGLFSAGCFAVNIKTSPEILELLSRKGTFIIASFSDSF